MGLNPWIVRPDGHQHEINGTQWIVEFCESAGVSGVAGEADAVSFACYEVAVVAAMIVAHHARAPVGDFERRKMDWAVTRRDGFALAPIEFVHVAEAMAVQEVSCGARRDDGRLAVEFPQTPHVEMIKMSVAQHDHVGRRHFFGRQGGGDISLGSEDERWDAGAHAVGENRVRDEMDAEKVNQNRRMAEHAPRDLVVPPSRRTRP